MSNFISRGWAGLEHAHNNIHNWVVGRGDRAIVPPDIQGLRAQNIQFLMSLMQPGAFDAGGMGANLFFGGADPTKTTSPETSVYNTARPFLEGMLRGTGPQFEQDIARANSTGGRFSSGNAIMRGEALRNLFNARTQTAQTLGVLGAQAGASQRDALSQHLQLLLGLFGMSGQASLSLPVENDKGALGDLLKLGVALASRGGGGGGGGGAPAVDWTQFSQHFQ